MKEELWKQIEGYPNHFVSNMGNVKVSQRRVKTPFKHFRSVPGKMLTPIVNGSKIRFSVSHKNTRKMMRQDELLRKYFPESLTLKTN